MIKIVEFEGQKINSFTTQQIRSMFSKMNMNYERDSKH